MAQSPCEETSVYRRARDSRRALGTEGSSLKTGDGGAVRQMRTSLRYPYPIQESGSEKAAPLRDSGAWVVL